MRLLLADDHHLVREALSFYLRQTADDVTVVEASNLGGALERAEAEPNLDAVILDLRMPGMNGLAGLAAMRAKASGVPVVILSGNISRQEAMEALKRGAA